MKMTPKSLVVLLKTRWSLHQSEQGRLSRIEMNMYVHNEMYTKMCIETQTKTQIVMFIEVLVISAHQVLWNI